MKSKKDLVILVLLVANLLLTGAVGLYARSAKDSPDRTAQYKMCIGTNDKDTGEQIIATEDAKQIVESICLKYLGGYTIQDATGGWTDENGQIVRENTIVCYFDDAEAEAVYHIADEVIAALNQSTVLIEKHLLEIEFYG